MGIGLQAKGGPSKPGNNFSKELMNCSKSGNTFELHTVSRSSLLSRKLQRVHTDSLSLLPTFWLYNYTPQRDGLHQRGSAFLFFLNPRKGKKDRKKERNKQEVTFLEIEREGLGRDSVRRSSAILVIRRGTLVSSFVTFQRLDVLLATEMAMVMLCGVPGSEFQ